MLGLFDGSNVVYVEFLIDIPMPKMFCKTHVEFSAFRHYTLNEF